MSNNFISTLRFLDILSFRPRALRGWRDLPKGLLSVMLLLVTYERLVGRAVTRHFRVQSLTYTYYRVYILCVLLGRPTYFQVQRYCGCWQASTAFLWCCFSSARQSFKSSSECSCCSVLGIYPLFISVLWFHSSALVVEEAAWYRLRVALGATAFLDL